MTTLAQAPDVSRLTDALAGRRRIAQKVRMSEEKNQTSQETRWWWIRHAPVTSYTGRIYGQLDVAANFDSTDVAIKALSSALPDAPVLIASDLHRASETAARIGEAGVEWLRCEQEPAFREQHFGKWQGLSTNVFSELRDTLPPSGWVAPAFERPPDGESFADVVGRVVPAVIHHTAENTGHDIVAVAHGGSIRAALSYALGLGAETALSFSLENLSLTRLDHIAMNEDGGVWRIVCINRVFS
mgnify:CR=1 FL=1